MDFRKGGPALSDLHPISGCDQAHREADVVFVHGLGGDPFLTWQSGVDKASSWPHWLGLEFPQVGVWSIGYPAGPSKRMQVLGWFSDRFRDAGHAMALPDRAAQLLDRMVQYGIGQRPLMFICHSLGGLVAKEILRASYDVVSGESRTIFTSTRAVLFLSTPHTGSELASLFSRFRTIFGPTIALKDLRAHDARLRNLLDWYRNHAHPPAVKTTTYYEGRTLKGVRIVDPSSSHPGVGDNPIALDEDHLSIAKPRQPNAQVCVAARDLLCRYVLAIPVVPSPPQPIPSPPFPPETGPKFWLWNILAALAVMPAAGIGSWGIYIHGSHGTPAFAPVTSSLLPESPRVNSPSPKRNTQSSPSVSQGTSTVASSMVSPAIKKEKVRVASSVDRSQSTSPKHSPPAPAPKLASASKALPPASAKPLSAPSQKQPSPADASPPVKQALSSPEVNLFRKLFGTKASQPGAPPATESSASTTEVQQHLPSAEAHADHLTREQYEDAKKAREQSLAAADQPVINAAELGNQARQLYTEKKYTEVVPIAKKACDLGNATGCLLTGQIYQYGEGEVPPNIDEAITSYRKACDNNSADGCFMLGRAYANQGLNSQAEALYQRACNGNNAAGCEFLGTKQLASNRAQAVDLLVKACELHNSIGCYRLGMLYSREKDDEKAQMFLGRACDLNFMYSCTALGFLYEKSPGIPDNKKQALQSYKKACNLGDPDACKRRKHLKL